MTGKIIKGIAGFYYIHVKDSGIYECKAKGIFRNQKIMPLVGDDVLIDVLDEENMLGNIRSIVKRKNELIRPSVANVDQALLMFAVAAPKPNFNLLDRFLCMMKQKNIPMIICFHKIDLIHENELEIFQNIYLRCGCQVLFTSIFQEGEMKEVKSCMQGKTTVLAGPSGVGKSSLMNILQPNANMDTGLLSEKIKRGKHTTRHSELIHIQEDTYVMDTPGFSSLHIHEFEADELKEYYEEFLPYAGTCKFRGCNHIKEPGCAVKQAVLEGNINEERYQNYTLLYKDLKEQRRY